MGDGAQRAPSAALWRRMDSCLRRNDGNGGGTMAARGGIPAYAGMTRRPGMGYALRIIPRQGVTPCIRASVYPCLRSDIGHSSMSAGAAASPPAASAKRGQSAVGRPQLHPHGGRPRRLRAFGVGFAPPRLPPCPRPCPSFPRKAATYSSPTPSDRLVYPRVALSSRPAPLRQALKRRAT